MTCGWTETSTVHIWLYLTLSFSVVNTYIRILHKVYWQEIDKLDIFYHSSIPLFGGYRYKGLHSFQWTVHSASAMFMIFAQEISKMFDNQFGQGYAIKWNRLLLIICIIWQNKVHCSSELSLEIRSRWALYASSRIVILLHWRNVFAYSVSEVWSTRHWRFWQDNWLTGSEPRAEVLQRGGASTPGE